MGAVQESRMTMSAATKQHLVPRKTLDNCIKGCVQNGTNLGPSIVLTAEEEGAQHPICCTWLIMVSL